MPGQTPQCCGSQCGMGHREKKPACTQQTVEHKSGYLDVQVHPLTRQNLLFLTTSKSLLPSPPHTHPVLKSQFHFALTLQEGRRASSLAKQPVEPQEEGGYSVNFHCPPDCPLPRVSAVAGSGMGPQGAVAVRSSQAKARISAVEVLRSELRLCPRTPSPQPSHS